MARIKEKTVYQFDELSDSAKERARDWFRQGMEFDGEYILEDATTCLAILGIDVRQRRVNLIGGGTRMEPAIYYSGFSSQGDGACFECSYSYAKDSARKIREHAPQDTVLHGIADGLGDVQRPHFYKLSATSRHTGHYSHSHSTTIDVDCDCPRGVSDEDSETVRELLRDCMNWIYHSLEKEYEYRTSDEAVDEDIRANEYEFDEDGSRA